MINGRKVNAACISGLIANAVLAYHGIMPLWITILSAEAFLIVMAFRSTAKKMETKLAAIEKKEFHVKPSIMNMR